MRTETNTRLVQRNRRIAQYLFFFSFGVLIAAFIANFNFDPTATDNTALFVLPLLALPIGLIATLASVRMTNLWIREPRPERMLREGLKGLSNKSVLYNYYHFPVRHVLVCPQGVFAITTRFQDGSYTVNRDRWVTEGGALNAFMRAFRRDGIGDPTTDAIEAAHHVKKLLQPIAPEVEVKPLIVFVDPRARLTVEDPVVPVLYASPKQKPNLIDYMRSFPRDQQNSLTPEQIESFEAATINR
jgi:hypothetical protein